ncbi:MAG: hypothetical protein GTN86_09350 [Xanthomonadales bacterium]|nr:hypothetical protein [Xanthomonadales bacterium]NIN60089.1 hypothetical protein [Xanthomonadales bacterium]NIN75459.1 hypothetical protein [Xanthomonadales bacterium]NIO13555.1 hypothetical protein [Xanthomonadales bacterium]NIP12482.1 hypothetical protein [Xanthomonadales bacterium]
MPANALTGLIAVFGLTMALLSLWGILQPARLIDRVLRFWKAPWGIHLAVAIRVLLGLVFILAAHRTRFPDLFRFLGYLMLVAAVLIPVMGRERLDRMIRWWQRRPAWAIRAWLAMAFAFGAFICYGAL